MDELLHALGAHRRRIRMTRAADSALRWAFYASVAASIGLAVSKFAGISLSLSLAAALLGTAPLAMAIREWSRAFSLHDCAVQLDRQLGLDERLSTAIEGAGPMAPLIQADAMGALARAPRPERRMPREGRLLGGSLLILAALLVIPSPRRLAAQGDPALVAVSAEEQAKLESLAKVDVQFQEAADALKEGRPEEALGLLEALRAKLAEKLLEGAGGNAAETQKQLDLVTASAAALSAELARLGRTHHAPVPALAKAKLDRQRVVEPALSPGAVPADASEPAKSAFADAEPWHPRYDPVIRRYFGRGP